jgi:hypothetical protein
MRKNSDRFKEDSNLESVSDVAITQKVEKRSYVFTLRHKKCVHILGIS